MKTTNILAASALSLTMAIPATAQTSPQDWDSDADGMISDTEFQTGFSGNGSFSQYDSDGDGMISQDEYTTASEGMTENWGERDYDMPSFSDSDTNADSMLDETEYSNGWYNTYDRDASGNIEEPELGDVGDDMGDGGLFDI